MLSKLLLVAPVLLVSVSSPVVAAPVAARAAQTPAPAPTPPDKRPEVEKVLEKFKSHTDKKGVEDRDAITVIDQSILPEFRNSGPKDRAAIVGALAKVFDLRRVEEKEGVANVDLFIASAVALGEMAPESTKPLIAAIDNKNLRKLPAVRHRLILSLGKTKDLKDGLEALINLLQDKEALLVSASAEALANYADADLPTRKKTFEALLKIVTSAKDSKDSNLNDTTARDRYDAIASSIVTTLGKLSKHDERDPDKWRDWWNKNKGKNWDA